MTESDASIHFSSGSEDDSNFPGKLFSSCFIDHCFHLGLVDSKSSFWDRLSEVTGLPIAQTPSQVFEEPKICVSRRDSASNDIDNNLVVNENTDDPIVEKTNHNILVCRYFTIFNSQLFL